MKSVVSVSLDGEVLERARGEAWAARISFSNWVEEAIIRSFTVGGDSKLEKPEGAVKTEKLDSVKKMGLKTANEVDFKSYSKDAQLSKRGVK